MSMTLKTTKNMCGGLERSLQNHHQTFHDRCPEKIWPVPKKTDHWFTGTCPENMGLASTCYMVRDSVWNMRKLLVAQRTTSGGRLGRLVNIEWLVEVMCCAHLTIFTFVDMIHPLMAFEDLGSLNRPSRWAFRSPSWFIGRLGRLGNLLFYIL